MTIKYLQLKHALALVEHRSFHSAAKAQNLSQPAFSRSIRNLEQTLGVSMFDRKSVGVTPTIYGEVVLRRAKRIMEESKELEREIQLLRGLEVGSFSLALALYPAELSGSRAAGELIRQYPNLRCRFSQGDWRKVINQVLARDVDLGLAEISVALEDSRLQVEPVGQHDLVIYCRSGHPLLRQSSISDADLAPYPLALIQLPARMANVFPGKSSVDKETGYLIPSVEVENISTARAIVLESDAFSAATPLQIKPWLESGEFVVLPYRPAWLTLNYGFICLRERMLSPAAEVFMQFVRRIEEELAPRNRELMEQIFTT